MKYGQKLTLKQLRIMAGLTQTDLAKALDTDRATLSKWETGTVPNAFMQVAMLEELYGIRWADDVLLPKA